MATSEMTSFQFFEVEPLAQADESLRSVMITCSANGSGERAALYFGDVRGNVWVVPRTHQLNTPPTTFVAYTSCVTHMKSLRNRKILLTIGDDADEPPCILKLWDMERMSLQPLKTIKLFPTKVGIPLPQPLIINFNTKIDLKYRTESRQEILQSNIQSPVVSFDVTEDLTLLVVSLTNNEMIILRGDVERDRSIKQKRMPVRNAKGNLLTALVQRCAIGFYVIYAVVSNTVVLYRLPFKGDTTEECVMETGLHGITSGACCAMSDDGQLVIATSDYLHFFGGEEAMDDWSRNNWDVTLLRPQVIALPAAKTKVMWLRALTVVVTRPDPDLKPHSFQLSIIERFEKSKLKLRVFGGQQGIFTNVTAVLSDQADLCVVCQDSKSTQESDLKYFRVVERDTSTKLELVFRKEEFDIGIAIAEKQEFDTGAIADIKRRYGDHLYDKGSYDEAIKQYIRTIGNLEPSYVIRKYLDVQRIRQLTHYLEDLHDERHAGAANEDHTTLLLNCYTKLRMDDKLKQFMMRRGIRFDADTAIKVCRQAGYYEQALNLALVNKKHDKYVSILMDKKEEKPELQLRNFKDALRYIQGLVLDDASKLLQKYGKMLLSKLPSETTAIMMEACTNWGPADEKPVSPSRSRGVNCASADKFIFAFVDSPAYLLQFLECVLENNPEVRLYSDEEKKIVYNTLLELYLTEKLGSFVKGEEKKDVAPTQYEERRRKALTLLDAAKGKYDNDWALFLVKRHKFEEGMLFMYKELELYQEVLDFYIEKYKSLPNRMSPEHSSLLKTILETCNKYGSLDSKLWVQVLTFLVSQPCVDMVDMSGQPTVDITMVQTVLHEIENAKLLPPLSVIDMLSKNRTMPLSSIKSFIINHIRGDVSSIGENQRTIDTLREEIEKGKTAMKATMAAVVFQSNRCDACNGTLELPATHFLCRHSYHNKCLLKAKECNKCSQTRQTCRERRAQYDRDADDFDSFLKDVETAENRFAVMSLYFGKGIFGQRHEREEILDDPYEGVPLDEDYHLVN